MWVLYVKWLFQILGFLSNRWVDTPLAQGTYQDFFCRFHNKSGDTYVYRLGRNINSTFYVITYFKPGWKEKPPKSATCPKTGAELESNKKRLHSHSHLPGIWFHRFPLCNVWAVLWGGFLFHTLIAYVGLFMGNLETCIEILDSWGVAWTFFFFFKGKAHSWSFRKWFLFFNSICIQCLSLVYLQLSIFYCIPHVLLASLLSILG